MSDISYGRAITLALVSGGLLGACTKQIEQKNTILSVRPKALMVKEFDLNQDNRPDSWRYYKVKEGQKSLDRKEFDLNFDGKVDLKRFYAEDGAVLRDEMDMDFDGKIDMECFYENNKLVRKELKTVRGKSSNATLMRKEYKEGSGLVNYLEGDRDRDGVNDYFYYMRDGVIVRRGTDSDGDGKPDKWEELE